MRLLLAVCVLVVLAVAESHAARTVEGVVRAVYDGDTILLATRESSRFKIRLYGVDAPETAKPDRPGQPFGEAARLVLTLTSFLKTPREGSAVAVRAARSTRRRSSSPFSKLVY